MVAPEGVTNRFHVTRRTAAGRTASVHGAASNRTNHVRLAPAMAQTPTTLIDATMSSRLVVAIVVAFVLSGCNTRPNAGAARDAALAADVEAFAARLAAGDEFSGVVLLTRYGRALVRKGYGLADRKAGRPNMPETPFMLSSVSKMFTAVTIAKLVEREQLSFDSTLGSVLPEYPSAEARDQVTVHHLLTMSSGIPDLFRVSEFWANIGSIKSPTDFWKYLGITPSVPSRHPMGLQQPPISSCSARSSNGRRGVRLPQ
jgi:CubicO group peptidase (beta-lactamase class C family)